jgi:hypothetical protein
MFRSGSKFLYALAAFGFVAAFFYSLATGRSEVGMDSLVGPLTLGYKGQVGDHVGYSILVVLGFSSLGLALLTSSLLDADPEAEAQILGLDAVPAVDVPSVSYWPIVGAFSVGAIAIGLAVAKPLFVIGMIGLACTIIEWAVQAWADRATGDPEVNRTIRSRFMYPIEIPVGAALLIGGFVYLMSRVLLATSKVGSAIVFGLVPAVILAVAVVIALRPKLSHSAIAAVLLVGGIAVLASGVIAGIAGTREIEEHHGEEEHGEGEGSLAPLDLSVPLVIRVGSDR